MSFKDHLIIFFICIASAVIMTHLGKQGTPTIELLKRIEKIERKLEVRNE